MAVEVGTLGAATGLVTATPPAVSDALEREATAREREYRSLMRKWWFGAAVGAVTMGMLRGRVVVER